MKKGRVLGIGLVFAFSVVSLGTTQYVYAQSNTNQSNIVGAAAVQMPNPFVDCDTLDEANKIAGFNLVIPQTLMTQYTTQAIAAVKDDLVQINLSNKEVNKLFIRKGAGREDISGDYNQYKQTKIYKIHDMSVTIKGDGSNASLATWTDGTYAYSVSVTTDDQGIALKNLQSIVSSIIDANDTVTVGGNDSINPFTEVKTLAEAKKSVGFAMSVPRTVSTNYPNRFIQVAPSLSMIEVSYYQGDAEEPNIGVTIRKAKSTENISGDYNQYTTTKKVRIGKQIIVLSGNDNKFNLATWTNGAYSYSVSYEDAVAQATILRAVRNTK